MKIKWHGHACFELKSNNNTKIITDPFDTQVGYAVPSVEADIVTSSHDHFDHNYVDCIAGPFEYITEPGKHSKTGIEIEGFTTFHDTSEGAERGRNIIFKYKIDGFNVCHFGDLGHMLSDQQINELGNIDIMMIPVGGNYTIDAETAYEIHKLLNPSVTIPMHYKTDDSNFDINNASQFMALGNGKAIDSRELDFGSSKDRPLIHKGIISLKYK